MTVLGKILAILNLVLSLVVGAFIIMTYVARTNWHAAYELQKKAAQVAQSDASTFKEDAKVAREEATKAIADLQVRDAQYKKDLADVERRAQAKVVEVTEQIKQNALHRANESTMSAELDRRQQEVKYQQGLIAKMTADLANMQNQVNQFRDSAVEAQIAKNAAMERNDRLNATLVELTKENQRLKSGAGSSSDKGIARRNPPAEDVVATIKQLDTESGLVTISLGSDSGINKGNTMEMYRLTPDTKYLGTLEILATRPNEAVGRPLSKNTGQLMVGDRVASSVMGRK